MFKRVITTGLCIIFLSVATAAFAQGVYATANGKKYLIFPRKSGHFEELVLA